METLTLKAETGRLLELVIHSLYTRREVFLRELVSNASDALDRFRMEGMLHSELLDDQALEIRVEVDVAARTLTVRDNGIGMTRDEVIEHIGTIARSGTREFAATLQDEHNRAQAAELIGRFGVGFYSCFMVADDVTLVTRRAGETRGTRWQSAGDVHYTVTDVDHAPRGTSVTLHLKPVDADAGLEDYTDRWVLSRIVKHYADFITYPIIYWGPPAEVKPDGTEDVAAISVVLNSMKPIWLRSSAEVPADEYDEFYKHITSDWSPPLLQMSFKAEGRWEYAALVYVPSHAPHDLYYHAASYGLQLHSQRMLIVENCQEVLPRYLRFLKGVIDAADLPLNVSRQTLQEAHHLTGIRKWLSRKVLDRLNRLREHDSAKYLAFWREFGRALKEGVSEDYENRDRLTPLLLFPSSHDPSSLTNLADYVARMKPEQKEIFYLTGESRDVIERSPHLEQLRARDYEVLYLNEPVDELLTQSLSEFNGTRLRSAAKGQVELGDEAAREQAERQVKEQTETLRPLLDHLARHLEARVRTVRVSRRLTVSPACLTGDDFDLSPHIEQLLNAGGATRRRILEVNANHAIVRRLYERFTADHQDPMVARAADLLFGIAALAEGSRVHDGATLADQVSDLLSLALAGPEIAQAVAD